MTVYLLYESSPWSSNQILGVYSTETLAHEARRKRQQDGRGHRSLYAVTPCVVDSEPTILYPVYNGRA